MNHPKIESPLLDELNDQCESLQDQLAEVDHSIKAERLRLVEELYGVKVGSIVSCKGTEYRVTSIDAHWQDKPWLKGNPRKKGGAFSAAERILFGDWTLVATNPTPEQE